MAFDLELDISGLNAFAFDPDEKLHVLVVNNTAVHPGCGPKPIPIHYPFLTVKFNQMTTGPNVTPVPGPDGDLMAAIPITADGPHARDLKLSVLPDGKCKRHNPIFGGDKAFKHVPSMRDIEATMVLDKAFTQEPPVAAELVLARLKLHGGKVSSRALELSPATGDPLRMDFIDKTNHLKKHSQNKVCKKVLFISTIQGASLEVEGFDDMIQLTPRWKDDVVHLSLTNLPRVNMSTGFHFARYFELCKGGKGTCIVPEPASTGFQLENAGNAFCPLVQYP